MIQVRKCCEGGLVGAGCNHDNCTGYRLGYCDEAEVEEPVVTEDDWLLGPACSTSPEECEACT